MTPRLAVMTGTRAEYGIFRPLLMAFRQRGWPFELYVTGTHLSERYGRTVQEIEADGFKPTECVDIALTDDAPTSIARSMGLALARFADILSRRMPDILFVLGDRFEAFAVATAAHLVGVPIAHLHGGERTEGATDEAFRHAITKLSQLHFVSTEEYRQRVCQLGEAANSVFCVGALGLDNLCTIDWMSRAELEKDLAFVFQKQNLLVTHHPLTLDLARSQQDFSALLDALDAFGDCGIVITKPNADSGNAAIADMIDVFAAKRPNQVRAVVSLGTRRYFSLLRHVDAVVGNSSSGLIEVPSFKIGTVDIGDRQKGRIAGPSVIAVPAERKAIEGAIRRALTPAFRALAQASPNPYGDGGVAERICRVIESTSFPLTRQKGFVDI